MDARSGARSRRGMVGVAVVLALAGLLFTSNASLARSTEQRNPENLADLVQNESARVEELAAEVEELRAEVDRLTTEQTGDLTTADQYYSELTEIAAGSVTVTGPGLTVQLTDARPSGPLPEGVSPDDLVVHQQDLQAVINALWAGGAEAMTLQGQRVVATSAFRCVGNVLLLHGRTYSPPYVVEAIGDPDRMRQALFDSPGVQVYLDYVAVVGLGWSVVERAELTLPPHEGALEMKYADVPEDTTVRPALPSPPPEAR